MFQILGSLIDLATGKNVALLSGQHIGYLSGHDRHTRSLANSSDGRKLVSTHPNSTAILWDTEAIQAMVDENWNDTGR